MEALVKLFSARLLVWLALFALLLTVRILRRDIAVAGMLQHDLGDDSRSVVPKIEKLAQSRLIAITPSASAIGSCGRARSGTVAAASAATARSAPRVCGSPPAFAAAPAKASLSRLQFLVFAFIVAGLFLVLSIRAGSFVDIPAGVLGLLGVSAGSFLVSRAIT